MCYALPYRYIPLTNKQKGHGGDYFNLGAALQPCGHHGPRREEERARSGWERHNTTIQCTNGALNEYKNPHRSGAVGTACLPHCLTPSPLGKRVLGVGWGAYSRGMEVAGPFRGSFIAFKPLSLGLTAATLPPPAEAARDDAPRQGC